MRIEVSTDVVAGTDQGGEDLYLTFRITQDKKPDFDDSLIFIANPCGNWDQPMERDKEIPEDQEISCSSSSIYDFKWKGKIADLREIIKDEIKNEENWSRSFDGKTYKFEYDHFVRGNAD
jgi:hypothetical protein